MKIKFDIFKSDEGSAIIIVLFILMMSTMIGLAATNTSFIETQIAGNRRFQKVAFYHSDSGIYTSTSVISSNIDEREPQSFAPPLYYLQDDGYGSFIKLDTDPTFFRELFGFDKHDPETDVRLTHGAAGLADIDYERVGAFNIAGGGAEFSSAGENVGGKGITFDLDSFGTALKNSSSNIGARYLKIAGVSGGM